MIGSTPVVGIVMKPLRRQFLRIAIFAGAASAPALAAAAGERLIDIRGGELASALVELSRETKTELLFDPRLVRGIAVSPVRGVLTPSIVLSRLLAGTGLGFRESGGTFDIYALPPPAYSPLAEEPVAEILVIGRRTQNADIRRSRNDIQPYKVVSSNDIEFAHRDNVDDLLRSREPSNAQIASPNQLLDIPGDTRSAVNLRGLGNSRTLILVDGRRMPQIPTTRFDFFQPDLNPIPLSVVERVETLTGTAGGIYGPSALGGIVNVVLRRDYEGGALRVTSGLTSRGDSWTRGIEGRFGLRTGNGRTALMAAGSIQEADPIRAGDRDYLLRQRLLQYSNDPVGYVDQKLTAKGGTRPPRSNAVSVFSGSPGGPLVLGPAFGGASLGAAYTFLPLGFEGTQQEAVEQLRQNAGKLVFEPADDVGTARATLRGAPSTRSAFFNLRHEFSNRIEAYVDGLWLRNKGAIAFGTPEQLVALPNIDINPFSQIVIITFPRPDVTGRFRQGITTRRFTAGLVARLPRGWSATADFSGGSADVTRSSKTRVIDFDLLIAVQRGQSPGGGLPRVDPLGSWSQLLQALQAYFGESIADESLKNRYRGAALRIAGPLFSLPGGSVTATGLLEWRSERVPPPIRTIVFTDRISVTEGSPRSQTVQSAYVELRAPLIAADGRLAPLSGLEFQLAGRFDRSRTNYPDGFGPGAGGKPPATRAERDAFTYTAGLRFFPAPLLMLRGSIATGEVPPTIADLRSSADFFRVQNTALADPLR
ncbi:MAG TPA: TonB-dependent receptor, partial [Allosphingosinicella sp.]